MTTTDSTEYRERVEFMSRLGFGDDKTEPAARLADIVDAIEYAFSQSSDHIDCPAWCELCGERLADKDCEPCHGSGCGPRTAEGAYDECEHCAGAGRIHEGCVGKTYAELAAANALLEGQLATAREEAAADKAKLAAANVEEEWAIRVVTEPGGTYWYHNESDGENPEQDLALTLQVLADGRDFSGRPVEHGPVSIVKRTVWSTEWETVEPSEMPRPPAPERAGDTNTSPAGSGRGTGVAEASGTAQESGVES